VDLHDKPFSLPFFPLCKKKKEKKKKKGPVYIH
jgi:hypothetical protein